MKEKTAKDVNLVGKNANGLVANEERIDNEQSNAPTADAVKVEELSDAGNEPIDKPIISAVKHYERKIGNSDDEMEKNVSKIQKLLIIFDLYV